MAWCDVVEPRTLRECRIALGQSQAAFAAMLGVSPESYRTWDAGRRATPPHVMARARALATHRDEHALLPLPVLALLIGVHVKTLRPADRRVPLTWAGVPDDYAEQIRALRRARGLSQAQLATLVGAARKAVVYDLLKRPTLTEQDWARCTSSAFRRASRSCRWRPGASRRCRGPTECSP